MMLLSWTGKIKLMFCGEPLNPPLLLLGICAKTAFVSMWMHNVAATVDQHPTTPPRTILS